MSLFNSCDLRCDRDGGSDSITTGCKDVITASTVRISAFHVFYSSAQTSLADRATMPAERWFLLNRAERVIKKWELSQANTPLDHRGCDKKSYECWNILLNLNTPNNKNDKKKNPSVVGLDQVLSHILQHTRGTQMEIRFTLSVMNAVCVQQLYSRKVYHFIVWIFLACCVT